MAEIQNRKQSITLIPVIMNKCKAFLKQTFWPYGISSQTCQNKEFKDGYCKTHHPKEKLSRQSERNKKKDELFNKANQPSPPSADTNKDYWKKRCEAAEQLWTDEKEYALHCSGENFIRLKSSLEIWQALKSNPPSGENKEQEELPECLIRLINEYDQCYFTYEEFIEQLKSYSITPKV